MLYSAIATGLLVALAVSLREAQLAKERRAVAVALGQVQAALTTSQLGVRRCADDLFVLRALLVERRLFDQAEFVRSRARLVKPPTSLAQTPVVASPPADPPPAQGGPEDVNITLH
jgi:hypothetical protein